MPYNNTPIAPNKEVTGTVSLPLARVKKIIHADEDIGPCSNNAAFAITLATEMFLQHLVEQAYNIVKSERKPRRNIQYRDVANAVSRVENLEFLSDVVPKTTTMKAHRERMREKAQKGEGVLGKGQGTLDGFGKGEGQAEDGAGEDRMEVDGEGEGEETEEVVMESAEGTGEDTPEVAAGKDGDGDRDMS